MTILCWYFGSLFDSWCDLFGDFTYFASFPHLLHIIISRVYIYIYTREIIMCKRCGNEAKYVKSPNKSHQESKRLPKYQHRMVIPKDSVYF